MKHADKKNVKRTDKKIMRYADKEALVKKVVHHILVGKIQLIDLDMLVDLDRISGLTPAELRKLADDRKDPIQRILGKDLRDLTEQYFRDNGEGTHKAIRIIPIKLYALETYKGLPTLAQLQDAVKKITSKPRQHWPRNFRKLSKEEAEEKLVQQEINRCIGSHTAAVALYVVVPGRTEPDDIFLQAQDILGERLATNNANRTISRINNAFEAGLYSQQVRDKLLARHDLSNVISIKDESKLG